MIDSVENERRQRLNRRDTALFLVAILGLLAVAGWTLGGALALLWFLGLGAFLLYLGQRVSPKVLVKLFKAQPIGEEQSPQLTTIMEELAKRADLPAVPQLYYVPSEVPNAFTTGRGKDAIVVVFDGLLKKLNLREMAGVLAHEVAHIKNRDVVILGIADVVSRLVRFLPWIALGTLLFQFLGKGPGSGGLQLSWIGIALFLFAPQISAALQRRLSHAREFDADQDGAVLTGDPRGLASALRSIENTGQSLLEKIFMPGKKQPHPSTMRTHPPTDQRVERLLSLETPTLPTLARSLVPESTPVDALPVSRQLATPRSRMGGLWW